MLSRGRNRATKNFALSNDDMRLMKNVILSSNDTSYCSNIADKDRKISSDVNNTDATPMQKNSSINSKSIAGRAQMKAQNKKRDSTDGGGLSVITVRVSAITAVVSLLGEGEDYRYFEIRLTYFIYVFAK